MEKLSIIELKNIEYRLLGSPDTRIFNSTRNWLNPVNLQLIPNIVILDKPDILLDGRIRFSKHKKLRFSRHFDTDKNLNCLDCETQIQIIRILREEINTTHIYRIYEWGNSNRVDYSVSGLLNV